MTAYTLHSGATYGLVNSSDVGAFTLGTEFEVTGTPNLTGIWFYSGATADATLPSACCLYDANAHTQIPGTLNSSPSWSGAAGSGWVKCTYSGPALSSSVKYVAAVYAAAASSWFSDVANYWTSGGGSGGLTNGPLSAPASSGAVNGQAVYNSGSGIAFPASTVSGYDFGVDVEVTSGGGTPHTATVSLTVAPSIAVAAGQRSTVALTVRPSVTVARQAAHVRAVSLAVAPSVRVARSGGAAQLSGYIPDGDEARAFKRWLLWEV